MQDRLGRTCLHLACGFGLPVHLIKRLVEECGAQVSVRDIEGQTPMHYAAMHDRAQILQYLLDSGGYDPSLLKVAVKNGSWRCVKVLS